MGLASRVRVGLLAAIVAAPVAVVAGTPPLPDPIATRQTSFLVPFRIERHDPRSPDPRAIQLFVSTDRGANWQYYATAEPAKGSFLFRADADGEYWFAIRTIDASGQVRRDGSDRPGLRVAVDTTPPQLQLSAQRGTAGQILARWQITDPNLRPESLKLEYRTDPNLPWQPIAIDPRNQRFSGASCSGEVSWLPHGPVERTQLRAEVADTAGNRLVTQALVGSPDDPFPPKPIPNENPFPAGPALPDPRLSPASGPSLGMPSGGIIEQDRAAGQTVFRSPEGTVAIQIQPASPSGYTPAGAAGPRATSYKGVPAGTRVRMVSAERFQLDYDVESLGPSGVARVELWGTQDGGRSWTSYGIDEDRRSPFLVTVKGEGLYGFHVAVRSGAGLGGEAPRPGTPPDVWIGVDRSKPVARILSAEQVAGGPISQLKIRWEASDAMLSARPIALLYSESRDGPWTTLAVGIENTGSYTWSLDRRVPERLFLRLEVRDEAGNLAIQETPEPLFLDQRRPQGRIREVRPVQ